MMKAPYWPGGESAGKSGTSPTHFVPSHAMPGRVGSHGLPCASAEARLYMMRRLAGHQNVQSGYMSQPVGSPGASIAFHFHGIWRSELVNLPSVSANPPQGSWNTSVWICDVGGPPYSLGAFQKVAVSIW